MEVCEIATRIDPEHGTVSSPAVEREITPLIRRAVEIAIGAQRQPSRLRPVGGIERNQRGQRAVGRYSEHRPIVVAATSNSRAVEITVGAQRQRGHWIRSIVIVERNQRGQRAVGRHFEHRPIVVATARFCCAVEIAVGSQCQRGHYWIRSIGAVEVTDCL